VLRSADARIDEQREYWESVERHECAAHSGHTLVRVLAPPVKADVRQCGTRSARVRTSPRRVGAWSRTP